MSDETTREATDRREQSETTLRRRRLAQLIATTGATVALDQLVPFEWKTPVASAASTCGNGTCSATGIPAEDQTNCPGDCPQSTSSSSSSSSSSGSGMGGNGTGGEGVGGRGQGGQGGMGDGSFTCTGSASFDASGGQLHIKVNLAAMSCTFATGVDLTGVLIIDAYPNSPSPSCYSPDDTILAASAGTLMGNGYVFDMPFNTAITITIETADMATTFEVTFTLNNASGIVAEMISAKIL